MAVPKSIIPVAAINSRTNNFQVALIYLIYDMFIIPRAIISRPFVGKSTLQNPSLMQKATIRFCLPIPTISTRGRRIGISRKALAEPLPIKNSKTHITRKMIIIDT